MLLPETFEFGFELVDLFLVFFLGQFEGVLSDLFFYLQLFHILLGGLDVVHLVLVVDHLLHSDYLFGRLFFGLALLLLALFLLSPLFKFLKPHRSLSRLPALLHILGLNRRYLLELFVQLLLLPGSFHFELL